MSSSEPANASDRPFYSKWFWKDWIAKSQGLTTLEKGAEMCLFGFAATCSSDLCTVPDDDVVLARISGLRLDHWRRLKPTVLRNWQLLPEGRWQHTRMLEDARLWSQHCENQRLRRTAGQPPVHPRSTAGPPELDPTRSREKLEVRSKRSEKAFDSVPVSGSHDQTGNGYVKTVRTRTVHTNHPDAIAQIDAMREAGLLPKIDAASETYFEPKP